MFSGFGVFFDWVLIPGVDVIFDWVLIQVLMRSLIGF